VLPCEHVERWNTGYKGKGRGGSCILGISNRGGGGARRSFCDSFDTAVFVEQGTWVYLGSRERPSLYDEVDDRAGVSGGLRCGTGGLGHSVF